MFRMKRVLLALSLVFTTSIVTAQTTLIYGEASPNRGARAKALQWFADQVTERSGGDLKIDIQWGGALFKADASVPSIHDGVADMGTVIAVYFPKEMVGYGVADLPLDNPDAWVGMRATDELMRTNAALKENTAQKGLVYIGTFTTSQVNIGCKGTAIRSLDDIEGLKVRGVGAYGKVFGELGANMVRMSIYKAYQGLDSGLLDCSQGYSYAVSALKQDEVMDSYTLLNWGQVGALGIFMNKDVHDSLSTEQQAILAEVGSEMADEYGRLVTIANDKAIEKMKAAGLEIVELPDSERQKLIDLGAKFVGSWEETAGESGLDGAPILTNYRELIDKYNKQLDDKGYPWSDN